MSVFLADFGLARSATTGSRYTRTGEALGTPQYMSPEQARGDVATLTPATDVWSLGCVLYELAAGRPPFDGGTPAEVLGQVLTGDPPRLRALRPDLPAALERVLRVALARRANDRFDGAAALRDDLARVLAGRPPRARVPGRRMRAIGLAAAALACVAGVGVIAARPPPGVTGGDRTGEGDATAAGLVARARARRSLDPRGAATLLGDALAREPARHPWRIERGLLLWAVGEDAQAVAEWRTVPGGTPETGWARAYEGLLGFVRLTGAAGNAALAEAAASDGRPGRLARAAQHAIAQRWGAARTELDGVPGWEAALLRGYVESGDPAGAPAASIRAFDAVLAEGIPFGWVFNNRGAVRLKTGDVAGALPDLDEAIRRDPTDPHAFVNRGLAWRAAGDAAAARRDLEAAVQVGAREASAWANLGIVRLEAGELTAARDALDEALRLDPRSVAARTTRGGVRVALGDHVGARADLDEALRLDPRCADAWSNRSNASRHLGEAAAAVREADEAVRLAPRSQPARSTRALARGAAGDFRGALEDHDEALRLAPDRVPEWTNRAATREAAGDPAGALRDFDAALGRAPDHVPARIGRGRLRLALGDLDGALEDLDRAVALDPARVSTCVDRGEVHLARFEFAEAIRDYDRALAGQPERAAVLVHRGIARRGLGDLVGALADWDRAVAIDPHLPAARNNRGVARSLLGDPAGAREDFDRALELDPADASAYLNRGSLRGSEGDLAGAIADLERALAVSPADWEARAPVEEMLGRFRAETSKGPGAGGGG